MKITISQEGINPITISTEANSIKKDAVLASSKIITFKVSKVDEFWNCLKEQKVKDYINELKRKYNTSNISNEDISKYYKINYAKTSNQSELNLNDINKYVKEFEGAKFIRILQSTSTVAHLITKKYNYDLRMFVKKDDGSIKSIFVCRVIAQN